MLINVRRRPCKRGQDCVMQNLFCWEGRVSFNKAPSLSAELSLHKVIQLWLKLYFLKRRIKVAFIYVPQ